MQSNLLQERKEHKPLSKIKFITKNLRDNLRDYARRSMREKKSFPETLSSLGIEYSNYKRKSEGYSLSLTQEAWQKIITLNFRECLLKLLDTYSSTTGFLFWQIPSHVSDIATLHRKINDLTFNEGQIKSLRNYVISLASKEDVLSDADFLEVIRKFLHEINSFYPLVQAQGKPSTKPPKSVKNSSVLQKPSTELITQIRKQPSKEVLNFIKILVQSVFSRNASPEELKTQSALYPKDHVFITTPEDSKKSGVAARTQPPFDGASLAAFLDLPLSEKHRQRIRKNIMLDLIISRIKAHRYFKIPPEGIRALKMLNYNNLNEWLENYWSKKTTMRLF